MDSQQRTLIFRLKEWWNKPYEHEYIVDYDPILGYVLYWLRPIGFATIRVHIGYSKEREDLKSIKEKHLEVLNDPSI